MNGKPRGPWLGPRWKRLLLILALALVAFEVLYVIAINVVLRAGTIPRVANAEIPDKFHFEIGPAWSVWPGRVHTDFVKLRFQDHNVQFSVELEHAVVDVSLWQLPFKVMHLTRIRGENARYLFRHKVESPKGLEARLEQYPKIPGFPDPPVFSEKRTPPLPDKEYNLWTIELNDVDASVAELWFLEYRWRGQGRVTGGFHLKPERDASTERCVLTLDEGTLQAGPHVVANHFAGRLTAQLDRHDPRKVAGEAIFGKISIETDLRGDVPNLNVTKLYTVGTDVDISRGAGTLVLKTVLEHGEWSEGSEVRYETDAVAIRKEKITVTGPAELRALISHGGKDSRVVLSATASRANLEWKGVPNAIPDPSARAAHASIGATADLTKPIRMTSVSAKLRAAVPSLRWVGYPLDEPGMFTGGSADANLRLEWVEGKLASGDVDARLEKAAFVLLEQPTEISGRVDVAGTYDDGNERGQLQKLAVELPEVGVKGESIPGGLHVRSERLQWQKMPPEKLTGRVEVTSQSISPLVPYIISSDLLRALAKTLVSLGKTRAVVEFERTPAAFELQIAEAKSGNVEAFGQYRSEKGTDFPCGRWYVQDGSLSIGVLQEGGETSVKPLVPATWWRERPVTPRCTVPSAAAKAEKDARPVRHSALFNEHWGSGK
jgi:hypothetical protein